MAKLTIESINAQLKAAKIRVKINTLPGKNTLFLRATLPPKPGCNRDSPYQQRIALGVYNNDVGLRYAKGEAIKLAGLLDTYQFSWETYKPELSKQPSRKTCKDWIQEFEDDFWARGDRTVTTWKDYRKVFKKLPGDKPLTLELGKEIILATEANTKNRERTTDKIASLCEFAKIENAKDLRKYRGIYSQKGKGTPLIIPSYEEIFNCLPGFHTEQWRNAFCLQAAFGLRNHEIYHVSLEKIDEGLLEVGDGTKTGYRVVPTCHPDWIGMWNIKEILPQDLPQSTATENEELGRLVWKAYDRAGVPFPPYSLRHRFACDCACQGRPLALAAKIMGHSVDVHTKIYHAFLGEKDLLNAWYGEDVNF